MHHYWVVEKIIYRGGGIFRVVAQVGEFRVGVCGMCGGSVGVCCGSVGACGGSVGVCGGSVGVCGGSVGSGGVIGIWQSVWTNTLVVGIVAIVVNAD